MRLSEFIALSQEQKRFTVLNEGVPIAKRKVALYMVFLFQLQGYYVETYCCEESKEIREFRIFHSVEHLTPYFEGISIDHLLDDQ